MQAFPFAFTYCCTPARETRASLRELCRHRAAVGVLASLAPLRLYAFAGGSSPSPLRVALRSCASADGALWSGCCALRLRWGDVGRRRGLGDVGRHRMFRMVRVANPTHPECQPDSFGMVTRTIRVGNPTHPEWSAPSGAPSSLNHSPYSSRVGPPDLSVGSGSGLDFRRPLVLLRLWSASS